MRPVARNVTGMEMRSLGAFIPENFTGDPKEMLDRAGPLLHRLLVLMDRQRDLMNVLWKRYLAECKRRGVDPKFSDGKGSHEHGEPATA